MGAVRGGGGKYLHIQTFGSQKHCHKRLTNYACTYMVTKTILKEEVYTLRHGC